jgi:hypothetical protein
VIGGTEVSNPDAKKPGSFIDNLVAVTSAILSRLAVLVNRFVEIVAVFTERFMDSLSAMTGQVSETVITGLAVSVAYDVVYDVIKKRWAGTPEEQEDFRQRAQKASDHLTQAAQILDDLQGELRERNQELEGLLAEIEVRQADAEHWRQIASVNEQLASALTAEIERRVRTQVRTELDKGKSRRRVFAAISWVITLVLGGVVGAVIQQWWQTGKLIP